MKKLLILIVLFSLLGVKISIAQHLTQGTKVDSIGRVSALQGVDTTYVFALPQVTIIHKWRPKYAPLSSSEKETNWKRIRDVKRVMPYVDVVSDLLIETYEYMETLPNDAARRKHLKRFEKELKEQYMPEMKKLTLSQGRLLMKLIDRRIGYTPYEIIKAFYGTFKAASYTLFAEFYGGKLDSHYDPQYNYDDALTERIIYLYEHQML